MGILASAPASFVANTRARASEVNAKFTEVDNAIRSGSRDLYSTGFRNALNDGNNTTLTGSECFIAGFYEIPTNMTFDIATSTARAVFLGALIGNTNSSFYVASGASAYIA